MRVLLLTHVFPRAADDPLGAFLLHLAQAMQGRAEISVVAPHAAGLKDKETIGGIPVTRFHYAPDPQETLAYTGVMHEQVARGIGGKTLFARFLNSYFLAARSAARTFKPDLIHAHWWLPGGFVGALVSRLTHTPLVVTTHGTDVEQLRRANWSKSLARFTFSRARVITCGSSYLRDRLIELNVADPARIRVMPMPVSPIFLNRKPEIKNQKSPIANPQSPIAMPFNRPNLQPSTFNILTAARLTKQKSIATLLEALAHLRARGVDAFLTIIGDGDQRPALQEKTSAAQLEPFVTFLGMRPQTELPTYYANCDCFVLPSIREGMGLVLAEALLCGAPVIGTNSGGITDIIRDGETGLLFPEGDAAALADALEKYARDPEYAARLAAQGCTYVTQRYTPAPVAQQFLQAFDTATSKTTL